MIMDPIEDFDEEIVGDDDDYETGNGNYKYHTKLFLNLNLNFTIFLCIFLDPEFAVEPVSESGPTGGPESVDIVDVDSDNDDDYLVEDDPSPSKL
jgi:hypothetical protein